MKLAEPSSDPELRLTADSDTWFGFLAKERSLLRSLLRRRIRIKRSPRLLLAFGKCSQKRRRYSDQVR